MIVIPFTPALAFAFLLFLPVRPTNIVFVGVAMALYTIVVITDAFLDVLAADLVRRVFVTTEAGVTAVVIADVAGDAAVIVFFVEFEIPEMIEGRRNPLLRGVTLAAVAGDLLMQGIAG